jgi:hypothetical protein
VDIPVLLKGAMKLEDGELLGKWFPVCDIEKGVVLDMEGDLLSRIDLRIHLVVFQKV